MEISAKKPAIHIDVYRVEKGKNDVGATVSRQDSGSGLQKDEVRLSQKVKKISEAKKVFNSIPDVRDDMVARLKQQIDNDTYKIEGEKIAFRMVKESLLNTLI